MPAIFGLSVRRSSNRVTAPYFHPWKTLSVRPPGENVKHVHIFVQYLKNLEPSIDIIRAHEGVYLVS